jgi:hypothetical protein
MQRLMLVIMDFSGPTAFAASIAALKWLLLANNNLTNLTVGPGREIRGMRMPSRWSNDHKHRCLPRMRRTLIP